MFVTEQSICRKKRTLLHKYSLQIFHQLMKREGWKVLLNAQNIYPKIVERR